MYTIAQIEDAVIARLRGELPYLGTCGSLADFLVDDVEGHALLFPAVYVAYRRGDFECKLSEVLDRTMTFTVFVIVKNMRGDEAARHGHGTEKGVYGILDDVRCALTRHDCGLNIDPLLPEFEQAVDGDGRLSIYGINFITRCRWYG